MESKKAGIIIAVVTIISLLGLFLSEFDLRLLFKPLTADVYYRITLSSPIELSETYRFHVKDRRFHVLFRNWEVPLTLKEKLSEPFVEVINENGTSDSYVKDFRGKLYGKFTSERSRKTALFYGRPNEVGIVDPDIFPPGDYKLNATYNLYPPIHTDGRFYHLNFKLAGFHVPYRNVVIEIVPEKTKIVEVFSHMKEFSVERENGKVVVRGRAPQNSLVEVELLTLPFSTYGFPRHVSDVKGKTERANRIPMLLHTLSNVLILFLKTLLILLPPALVFIYLKFGREKDFTVPRFLSFIPNPERKPYEVNLLFTGDAAQGNENGFYATVLDLMRREFISVKPEGDDLLIKVLKEPEDPYEKKVTDFFKRHSVNGIFSLKALKNRVEWARNEKNISYLKSLKAELDSLLKYENDELVNRHLNLKGVKIADTFGRFSFFLFIIISFSLLFFLRFFSTFNGYSVFILSLTLFIASLIAAASPSQIFGRWKKNYYMEKLQWEAFKKFLSDFALIKKYAPEDVVIWKEWLVYGTALGVAEKVEEALKKFAKVEIPEVKTLNAVRGNFSSFSSTLSSSISQASPSGSSGFGSGGGFGGGGAGGR